LRTRNPSIVVSTNSPASKSGTAARGVGDAAGDRVGTALGEAVGANDGVGDGLGGDDSRGGSVQADIVSARSRLIGLRKIPTSSG